MAQEVITARERSVFSTANAERQATRTVGGETEAGYSPTLRRAILSYEDRQRREENEAMAFYDDDGYQVARIQGKGARVPVRKEDVPSGDLIMTHNHPSALGQSGYMRIGSSFSMEDMLLAVKYKAKEMRAVTPTYTFSIKRPKGGWGATQAAVRRAYEKAQEQVLGEGQLYADRVGYSQTVENRYTITYWHKVNKLVAKEFGWKYSKKNH